MTPDINAILNVVCVAASVIFFIAKLDAMTKSNREFYESTINNLHENMNDKFMFLETNMSEKFSSVNSRFETIKEDIQRLEHKQAESNKIKERLAIVEHAIRTSAYHGHRIIPDHLETYNSLHDKQQ